MSENFGSFDQLANALNAQRSAVPQQKAPRRQKKQKEIDRSRDHAVYAAPHHPIRAHAYSRPDDIATQRAARRERLASEAKPEGDAKGKAKAKRGLAQRGIPLALLAFLVTTAIGLAVFLR
jgi:hypothetical protein